MLRLRLIDLGINSVGFHFVDECVNSDAIKTLLSGIDLNGLEINLYST